MNYPLLLVVHPSVPVKTTLDLVNLAKAKPQQLFFASPGSGNSGHLAGELFNTMAHVQTVHVPYKGQGPALADLLTGQVQMLYSSIPSVLPQVRSGQLNALAVGSAKRLPSLPDIPTIAETGVPGYEAYSWVGIVAPAKTPKAIIDQVNRDVNTILKRPEVRARIEETGSVAEGGTQAELNALNHAVKGDACETITDAALGKVERLVVQYAAQITVKVKVEDALFKQISQHFDTTGVVELTTAIATYNMVARFLTALQITPDGEQAR